MNTPNILLLTSHDTGDWLHCYGHETVQSPHLDSLAREGCRFTNSFCASPVCTPSRGAMMTGRYPQSNGLMGIIQTPYRWRLRANEHHLSHLLGGQGYHTVLFNHQHEAPLEDPLGFMEHRLVNCGSLELLTGESVSTADDVADEVTRFFAERSADDVPFYAHVGFFETHTPYDWSGAQPDDSRGVEVPPYVEDTHEVQEKIAALQGAIRYLDEAVGKILHGLSESGHGNNTIVIFAVDHGVELPRCKWRLYDGGMRTALLMRVPNTLSSPGAPVRSGAAYDSLVSNVDLVPTLLDLIDLPKPSNLQGVSFADYFGKTEAEQPRDAVYAMMHSNGVWVESRCVRTRTHKLIRNFSPSRVPPAEQPAGQSATIERPIVELYDLITDPNEANNLVTSAAHESVRLDLDRRLLQWLRDVDDPILVGPVRTPYYEMAIADLMKNGN